LNCYEHVKKNPEKKKGAKVRTENTSTWSGNLGIPPNETLKKTKKRNDNGERGGKERQEASSIAKAPYFEAGV